MKTLTQFIQEALEPYQAKKVDQWVQKHQQDGAAPAQKLSEHVFDNKEVLYHPFDQESSSRPDSEVLKHLSGHGYSVPTDKEYHAGYAVDKHNRITSIGKALKKTNATPEVVSKFENDPNRHGSSKTNLSIAYTWEPHHVAGMSTNRGWTSCMDMEHGSNRYRLEDDIQHGTHAAYLIHSSDKDIENPLARIALKPMRSGDHTILRPESRVYGTSHGKFHSDVSEWASTHFPAIPGKTYTAHPEVYHDTLSQYAEHSPEHVTKMVNDHLHSMADENDLVHMTMPENNRQAIKEIIHHPNLDPRQRDNVLYKMLSNHNVPSDSVADIYKAKKAGLVRNNPEDFFKMVEHPNIDNKTMHDLVNDHIETKTPITAGLNHRGISREQLDKIVANHPDDAYAVPHNRVTPHIADTVVNHFKSMPVMSREEAMLPASVLKSRAFGKGHIDSIIESNAHSPYNLNRITRDISDNPNFTIDHARDMDVKHKTNMAILHPKATAGDVPDTEIHSRYRNKMKSPEAFDAAFEKRPTDFITDSSFGSSEVPKGSKYAGLLYSIHSNRLATKTPEAIESVIRTGHLGHKGLIGDSISRSAKSFHIGTIEHHSENPRYHDAIDSAMNSAVDSGDVLHAHAIANAARENMKFKRSTLEKIDKAGEEHGYRPLVGKKGYDLND